MNKKSFKDSNPAMAFISKPEVDNKHKSGSKSIKDSEVQSADNTPDAQDVQIEQEVQGTQQSVRKTPKTQGKKGQKLPRINMAFDEENIEYLRLISRIRGVSMTQYVNNLLNEDRKVNDNLLKKAEKLLGM